MSTIDAYAYVFIIGVLAALLAVISVSGAILAFRVIKRRDAVERDLLNRFMAGDWREYANFNEKANCTSEDKIKMMKLENDLAVNVAKSGSTGVGVSSADGKSGYPIS